MNAFTKFDATATAPAGAPAKSAISQKAMLGAVRISVWSGRKLDREVTNEVNRNHGAGADAGRYNKALVSKDALAAITEISNRARKEHYSRTLPWHDDGNRILPAAGYLEYADIMRQLRGEFQTAVADFIGGYQAYKDDARVRLNGMFKESDYPPADDIARRFGFDIVVSPMPDASDFRVDVSESEADRIRADIQARTNEAIEKAMADVFTRVCETVGHMAKALAGDRVDDKGKSKPAIFRDSLVGNVRDLVALLPSLNITGDRMLADVARRMESDLCGIDADDLRKDAGARKETADKAAAIVADVSAYLA